MFYYSPAVTAVVIPCKNGLYLFFQLNLKLDRHDGSTVYIRFKPNLLPHSTNLFFSSTLMQIPHFHRGCAAV